MYWCTAVVAYTICMRLLGVTTADVFFTLLWFQHVQSSVQQAQGQCKGICNQIASLKIISHSQCAAAAALKQMRLHACAHLDCYPKSSLV